MRKIIILFAAGLILTACSKEFEQRDVTYTFQNGPNIGSVSYLDTEGELQTENFNVKDMPFKRWQKTLKAQQGNPLYMYLRYPKDEGVSFPMMTFRASILIDGKTYSHTNRVNDYDSVMVGGTTYYTLKLFGTVPF